ncbi:MAG: hypothetical protein JKY82_01915 [Rhizobiaceae bacterium]|nr:hypothetical protein [Rhizobiaceae bacterium]
MFRNLPIETFDQFNSLTKSYIGNLPPVNEEMPTSGNVHAQVAREKVRIFLECKTSQSHPIEALFRLRKIAETAVFLKKIHADQLLILSEVLEALREVDRIVLFSEADKWRQAFEQIVIYMRGCSFRHNSTGADREQLLGEAFRALSRKGFSYRIDGRGVSLTERSYSAVCYRIEKKIKRVGGEHVANAMLNLMHKSGRVEDGTLIHARTPTSWGGSARSGTPWHYIYSLALKYIATTPKARNSEPILEQMEELSVSLAATLDVEPHSSYENLSLSPPSLVGVLYETVIYDELFAFPQWQPIASKNLLPLWIDALSAEECIFPIATAEEWKAFGLNLLRCAADHELVVVTRTHLHSHGISASVSNLLTIANSAPNDGVNQAFETPSDTLQRTASTYPILPASGNNLALQPKSIVGRAFCECLYLAMRNAEVPDLENKMGKALERLTKVVFEKAGFAVCVTGETYHNDVMEKNLEVDLVIETKDRIFLVECTKKSLTNRARAGHTLDGLRDLGESFVKLTQQLSQHEAHIRVGGKIQFNNGQTINLAGRSIEKVAINLFDHGSLQNRDMTMGFIEALAGAHMQSDDLSSKKIILKFNQRLANLSEALVAIVNTHPDGPDRGLFRFAMSSWWLSIDQLQYLALKEGDLWKSMQRVRHMTAKSGDLVYELRRVMNMNEVGNAIFEKCKEMDNRGVL